MYIQVELLQDTGEEDCQFKILPLHGDYGLGSEVYMNSFTDYYRGLQVGCPVRAIGKWELTV